MSKKEKIDNFKEIFGVRDDVAEKYLAKKNWDENAAILLYLEENKDNPETNQIKQSLRPAPGQKELKITEALYSTEEVFTKKEQYSFNDLVKYLEEKFYVSQNFEEFLSKLKKGAGLVIILTAGTTLDVRNNMIRAANNALCLDILKGSTIFPFTKESKTGSEFIKQLNPKDYPTYIFCKYKNSQVVTINNVAEVKFRMENVINNLLDCFPEDDVKQSIYKSVKASIITFKKEKPEQNDDFTGDEKEVNTLLNKLQKDIKLSTTLFHIRQRQNQNQNQNQNQGQNQNPNQGQNQDQIEIEDDNPFSPEKKLQMPKNVDQGGNNRFRDLFANDETTIFMKQMNDRRPQPKEDDPLDIPTSKEFKIIMTNNLIPKEPEENDPNACTITFRFPYGEKQKIRRFNKNEKIEGLYNYVKSLGREIYSNPQHNNFELIYGFPPINFENKRHLTLDEEGLFPASMINIVEK